MKKLLITGADGFIGSHLVEAALRAGYDVRAFVCYNSFGSWGWLDTIPQASLDSIEVVAGDIRDASRVTRAVEGSDAVLHLAALIAIPYSYLAAQSYVDTNVSGTLNVLEACKHANVSQVIHTSTSEVYGTAQKVPISEDHPLHAQSPYAASKVAADQLSMSYHYSFEMPVTIIRPFNTYGPRQSARAVIPTVISQIAEGRKQIRLGALHPTRDFNFVSDTVAGFLSALGKKEAFGRTINIGSNFEISIGDTVALIAKVMNAEIEIVTDADRLRPGASEVERLYSDNQLARSILDWVPAYGGREGLARGLTETAAWFTQPENLKQYKTNLYGV